MIPNWFIWWYYWNRDILEPVIMATLGLLTLASVIIPDTLVVFGIMAVIWILFLMWTFYVDSKIHNK